MDYMDFLKSPKAVQMAKEYQAQQKVMVAKVQTDKTRTKYKKEQLDKIVVN